MAPRSRRARILWDEARRPGAPTTALLRAILYELQPIRFASLRESYPSVIHSIQKSQTFCTETVPSFVKITWSFLKCLERKHWKIIGAVVLYYFVIRWVHRALDAGPIFMIMTALVVIFTVGLGDEEDDSGVSAYSVFNRGFQRIMGSVDAENLLQQHVGGAMGMGGMMVGGGGAAQVANPPPARAPARRRNQHQARAEQNGEENNNNNNNNNDTNEDIPHNRSRKSGKKARRRNLEQRRELQRQRQAAMQMGFGGGDEQEMMAMQQILEEQIAANENQ